MAMFGDRMWLRFISWGVVLCAAVAANAAEFRSSSFKQVWDAAEGLRANVNSGGHKNPYPMSDGAIWGYYKSMTALHTRDEALPKLLKATAYNTDMADSALAGFNKLGATNSGSPHLYANITPNGAGESSHGIQGNELFIHPGASSDNNKYVILRFTVPHDGYYSSLSYFKDISITTSASVTKGWGVEVIVAIDGVEQVCAVVSAEGKGKGNTKEFTFLSPVRWCTAGTTFDFIVGNNEHNDSDATLVKVEVREENEGCFFDAGRALRANVTGDSVNPCGSAAGGTWTYYQQDTIGGTLGGLLSSQGNLVDSDSQVVAKGFYQLNGSSSNPRIYANTEDVKITPGAEQVTPPSGTRTSWYGTAPNEIFTHPYGSTRHAVVRFQPSQSGWYTMEAVFRHINSNSNSDGVDVHIVAGRVDQTNAVICAKDENQTVRLTCGPVLLVVGEPVDFVVGPNTGYASDSTAFSAVVRRETDGVTDVWDASAALMNSFAQTVNPYTDALGGEWIFGRKNTPEGIAFGTNGTTYTATEYDGWRPGGNLPRVCYNKTDAPITTGMFPMVPNELFMHPNNPNGSDSSAAVRFVAPSSGVYRVKAKFQHMSLNFNDGDNKNNPYTRDGVWPHLVVNGTVLDVMRKCLWAAPGGDATILDADALTLAKGDVVDFVVHAGTNHSSDATGVGFCVAPGTGLAGEIANINFAAPDAHAGRSLCRDYGRTGLSAPVWNALAPVAADTATTRCLWDQDGTRRWDTELSIQRASGTIAWTKASGADTLTGAGIASSGPDDVYTVTLSRLKRNAAYTLCFNYLPGSEPFTVNQRPVPVFTVPGATLKWPVSTASTFSVYEGATADAEGNLSFTFKGSSADGTAVVNGMQISGEFPEYVPCGLMLIIR